MVALPDRLLVGMIVGAIEDPEGPTGRVDEMEVEVMEGESEAVAVLVGVVVEDWMGEDVLCDTWPEVEIVTTGLEIEVLIEVTVPGPVERPVDCLEITVVEALPLLA